VVLGGIGGQAWGEAAAAAAAAAAGVPMQHMTGVCVCVGGGAAWMENGLCEGEGGGGCRHD
jgi:hypothetical protein